MLTRASLPEAVGKLAASLPAFPAIVMRLLEMVEDEGAALDEIVRLARRDPVILAKVMATANRIRRVKALADIDNPFVAASLIGLDQLRRVVITAAMNKFADDDGGALFLREHSRAVAIVAQELALMVGVSPEGAYMLGILHDIGQLGLHVLDAGLFRTVYTRAASGGSLVDLEREAFGVDHAELGGALAEFWMLPDDYVAAIRMHHADKSAISRLQAVVNVAESLARSLDIPSSPRNRISGVNQAALQLLGIQWNSPNMGDFFGRCRSRYRFSMK
jgi:putative nucleotidyltransferase with HDIG domain